MPIHIDRMDTSIEITSPTATPVRGGETRSAPPDGALAREAVRDVVGRVMADELERFLRNRGM